MRNVVIGALGIYIDKREKDGRENTFRPSLSLFQQQGFPVHRLEIFHGREFTRTFNELEEDIKSVSPSAEVNSHLIKFIDPWDFIEVFQKLLDFARHYSFNPDEENYYLHISCGTHVIQTCLFLLSETHHFPAKLIQARDNENPRIIDLDLEMYNTIASRFNLGEKEGLSYLKNGIETLNVQFNELISEIENVAYKSDQPIILMGSPGSGKTKLAKRIYDFKKNIKQLSGEFVAVNCAVLGGDLGKSTLFGHKKGAFTGATHDRAGLLKKADGGIIFLDEIGELNLDMQTKVLQALEEKKYYPEGSDEPVTVDFQLISATNSDLYAKVKKKEFREDLLARIDTWKFNLPSLKERKEDIEPNIEYELSRYTSEKVKRVRFDKMAKNKFLDFAKSSNTKWYGNFRDLNKTIIRMAAISDNGKITEDNVETEIQYLQSIWKHMEGDSTESILEEIIGQEKYSQIDTFDRIQLEYALKVCEEVKSLSEAGRRLYQVSRNNKGSSNDAARLRNYLIKYGLKWDRDKKIIIPV